MVHITASEDRMDSADGSSHTHGNGSTPLSLYTLPPIPKKALLCLKSCAHFSKECNLQPPLRKHYI